MRNSGPVVLCNIMFVYQAGGQCCEAGRLLSGSDIEVRIRNIGTTVGNIHALLHLYQQYVRARVSEPACFGAAPAPERT